MNALIITPPAVFLIVFLAAWLFARLCSGLAFRVSKKPDGTGKSYACGESSYNDSAHPDYSTFFSFAFFFTLAHVATLVMMTIPAVTLSSFAMILIYILGVVLGLSVLLRK